MAKKQQHIDGRGAKPGHPGYGGRPKGILRPCGWCGIPQTASEDRRHFRLCPMRPAIPYGNGVLYFCITEDKSILKIGFSKQLHVRLPAQQREAKTWFSQSVRLLGVIPATQQDELVLRRQIEAIGKTTHCRRIRCRPSTEWYYYTDPVRQYIEQLLAEGKPPSPGLIS
jgi:hypothetical protein